MKKNIELISKQIYDTSNIEENVIKSIAEITTEEDEYKIVFKENVEKIVIPYEIVLKKDKVVYTRAGNKIMLEKNKETSSNYKTEYGDILMKFYLSKFDIEYENEELKKVYLKYKINAGEMIKYESEIIINL